MIKIVVLDGHPLNPGDLSWEGLHALGEVALYTQTKPEEVVSRSKDADVLVVNKVILDEAVMEKLPQLKCICVAATGYNNIDVEAAKARNIRAYNVVGYSTASVAQHVFALLLELTNRVADHAKSVRDGDWQRGGIWSYWNHTIPELDGKTMGIVGLGKIGSKVADIATAFGMNVLAHHKHPERDVRLDVTFTDLKTLFSKSDVISLHCPLTPSNPGFVSATLLQRMKPTALLINTSRGQLINDTALLAALQKNSIAGAALDVLSEEPPTKLNPLLLLPNCLITPHQAWASRESRSRLMAGIVSNIKDWKAGKAGNIC